MLLICFDALVSHNFTEPFQKPMFTELLRLILNALGSYVFLVYLAPIAMT